MSVLAYFGTIIASIGWMYLVVFMSAKAKSEAPIYIAGASVLAGSLLALLS